MSKRPNGTGKRPGFSRTSQLRVKLGMMRPPISEISNTTTAMPMRMPASRRHRNAPRDETRHCRRAARRTSMTTLRLFQLRPAMISRAAAAATSNRKLASTSIAASQPVSAENVTTRRPAIQTTTSEQQGPALYRQPSGPVRDCREQETRDHRRQIAVEHFVDVPVARRKGRDQRQLAIKHRQPDQDRQPGMERAQQEERPKAVGKQRPALIGAGRESAPAIAALPITGLTSPRQPASSVGRTAPQKPAWPCRPAEPPWPPRDCPALPTTISATMPMP